MNRCVALCLLLGMGAARADGGATLAIEDAVAEALRVSDQLQAARYRAEAGEDQARSARGRLLPALSVSETYLHYSSPFTIQIAGPPVTLRKSDTNLVTVSGQQPLLGLLSRTHDYAAADSSARASRADEASTRAVVAEQVRVSYLRLFEAKAGVTVAEASLEQLRKQLQDAGARFEAGTITRADLLRFQTAVASARQQLIDASTQVLIARHALLTLLARDPEDKTVQFVEPVDLERRAATPVPELVNDLVKVAVLRRPEVERATNRAEASRANSLARALELLPEVDVLVAYSNAAGQLFLPSNQFYIGVTTSWPFWTWGTREYAAHSARKQLAVAEALERDERRQVALEVSDRYAELQARFVAVEVAQTAVESAEEAYRVTTELVAAGSASTTDLLDAQSALTSAKISLARAQYERAIARVLLDRATSAQ